MSFEITYDAMLGRLREKDAGAGPSPEMDWNPIAGQPPTDGGQG